MGDGANGRAFGRAAGRRGADGGARRVERRHGSQYGCGAGDGEPADAGRRSGVGRLVRRDSAGLAGGSAGGAGQLMRISINLATRPFVELRPLFARLRLAMAGLALLAAVLGFGLHSMNVRARAAQAQMDVLKAQTRTLEVEQEIRTPAR